MPTYEYRCRACGHAFERFQKITADPVRTCPECGEEEVERLISPGGGLVFKGSGFYATDYRDSRPSGKGEGGEGEGSPDAADGDGDPEARESASSDGDAAGSPDSDDDG